MSQLVRYMAPQTPVTSPAEAMPEELKLRQSTNPTTLPPETAVPDNLRDAPVGIQKNASPVKANQPTQEFDTGGSPEAGGTAGPG